MYRTKQQLLDKIEELTDLTRLQEMKIERLNQKLECKNRDILTGGEKELPVCKFLACYYCENSVRFNDTEDGWVRLCIKNVPCDGFILAEKEKR